MPVVTTLHTVLREPRADQRRVMQELISLSTRVVVMTERGRQMLQEIYHAPTAKIDLIAHGIPDVGFVDPTYFKDQFGVEGKVVLLTFGLLSPEQRHRVRAERSAGDRGGVSRSCLHRPGRHSSQRTARARRSLPREPGNACQEE